MVHTQKEIISNDDSIPVELLFVFGGTINSFPVHALKLDICSKSIESTSLVKENRLHFDLVKRNRIVLKSKES